MKRKVIYLTIAVVAVIFRLFLNYQSPLIPGINGGYYPLQVRVLLESGHLGFSDMPLYFLVNAFLVKAATLFTSSDMNSLIMHVIKITDSLFLPMLIFPLYLFSRKILKGGIPLYYELAVIAFAVLSFSPLILTSDLQKNAFAVPLMLFFFTCFLLFLKTKTRQTLLFSILFLLATGVTHFGVFAVSVLALLIGLILVYRAKAMIPVLLIPILGLLLVYIFDSARAMRLLSLFSVIFAKPAILYAPLSPPDILNYLLSGVLIIGAIYTLIKQRHEMSEYTKNSILIFLILILFLSFPLFDVEYSKRFSLLLFIPQSMLLLLLHTFISTKQKHITASLVFFATVVSILFITGKPKPPAISMDAFIDLQRVERYIENPEHTLIIARHGLEWWTAWQLHTKVAQDKAVDKKMFAKYTTIITLQQKKGVNQTGPGATLFHEPLLPPSRTLVFTSDYFSAYEWLE